MTVQFVITLFLTLGMVAALIISIIKDYENAIFGWSMCLLMTGLFGWGLLGCIVPNYSISEKTNVEITKSSKMVYVSTSIDGSLKTFEFKTHEDYEAINDSTCTFYLTIRYNMYHCQTGNYSLDYVNTK